MDSSRRYIFGIHYDGNKEFLISVLCDEDAVKYCKKHRKVFGDRFDKYTYGKMSEEYNQWRFYEQS